MPGHALGALCSCNHVLPRPPATPHNAPPCSPLLPRPAAAAVFSGLDALQAGAAKGSAADAKRGFVSTVSALKSWAAAAEVAGDLKGL